MRTEFHQRLDGLAADLARMCGQAGDEIERATHSLLQADLEAAEVVIGNLDQLTARKNQQAGDHIDRATPYQRQADHEAAEVVIGNQDHHTPRKNQVEHDAFQLLALQAPVAADLRAVVGALQTAADADRMGGLSAHVARIVRRRHPARVLPEEVDGYFAEMGEVAVALARGAQEVVLSGDVDLAKQILDDDQTMDGLHRHLFTMVLGGDWRHGVGAAVDMVLLGRFYERFADHAVEIARRIIFQTTGSKLTDNDAPAD